MDLTAYRHESSSADSTSLWDETENDDDDIELANISETAFYVYQNLWQEFYNWEQDYCRSTLANLQRHALKSDPLPEPTGPFIINPNSRSEWFTIEDFDDVESRLTTIQVASREPFHLPRAKPYPKYTACTPASENLMAMPNQHLSARFYPFADDERFGMASPSYLEEFEDFMWQTDFLDPDLEMIQLEAARRLHYGHQVSFENINKLHIFAFPLWKTNRSGLIWYCHQRDQLWWPGSQMSVLEKLPSRFVNADLSLEQNIKKDLPQFCARPNCLKSCCKLHDVPVPYKPPKPSLTNESLQSDGSASCGEMCFKTVNFDHLNKENYHWEETERELFKSVFHLAPDTSPCDLSTICRKPCFEMYIERSKLLTAMDPDEIPMDASAQSKDNSRVDISFKEDIFNDHIKVGLGHAITKGLAIQRAVYAIKPNKGVNDTAAAQVLAISDGKVAGALAPKCRVPQIDALVGKFRENATPFFASGAMPGSTDRRCRNTELQKGRFVSLRISEAQYGLGAYATSDLPEGKYIGEYVGELYGLKMLYWMGDLHKFTKMNYAFSIHNEADALDSWYIGNETRYLNHSEIANCVAEVRLVNGDQRIVLATTRCIKAGEELFLDYGQKYWIEGTEAS